MRLVIADDQGSNRIYLSRILEKMRHEVVTCENGQEVLELAEKGLIPQLVILDWMMPEMTGLEVCEGLRKIPHLHYLHIIMLTGRANQEDVLAGMRAGANDYMTKPIKIDEFQSRFDNAIRMIELNNELDQKRLMQIQAYRLMGVNQIAQNLVADLSEPVVEMLEDLAKIEDALEEDNKAAIRVAHDHLVASALNIGKTVRNVGLLGSNLELQRNERISIASLFQQLNSFFASQSERARVDLYTAAINTSVAVEGRRSEIFQALVNLVDNAIHAASLATDKWVRIEDTATDSEVRIEITDSGRGIPENIRKKLFEPFFSTKIEGNGLGLSITRDIVARHGGAIGLDDNSVKTRFFISLPRQANLQTRSARSA